MKSGWSDAEASAFVARHAPAWGSDLALRTYTSRLLGAEPDLVLHGGGNTSVKTTRTGSLGEAQRVLYVKASGHDLATIEPEGYTGLDLGAIEPLRALSTLTDEEMRGHLMTHLVRFPSASPSVETLVHAFIPETFLDHTHAAAVLALTNQRDGAALIAEALGEDVIVIDYVEPGFDLAKAAASAYTAHPGKRGMVWRHHGLLTWGAAARDSYDAMIELVTRAERFLEARARGAPGWPTAARRSGARKAESGQAKHTHDAGDAETKETQEANHDSLAKGETAETNAETGRAVGTSTAWKRLTALAPLLRGRLALPTGDPDRPFRRVILAPLVDDEIRTFLDSPRAKELALSPPLTTDHLVRTKGLPLWIDLPALENDEPQRERLVRGIEGYAVAYDAYLDRHASSLPGGVPRFDALPRVVLLPGLGAIAAGPTLEAAIIARDITAQTLRVKARIGAMGAVYEGLPEERLFRMEYRRLQHDKLALSLPAGPLEGEVALVTGAAGAIGSGICRELLEQGCLVAASDLPGERLDGLVAELRADFGARVIGPGLDATDPGSVSEGFGEISRTWGGVDLVVINAGIAQVASLAELPLEEFRRLTKVNVEGALLVLAEAGRHFERQGTGGDIVFVSSKNVFAPGAGFGAYSATKAGAHQLARIAGLELARLGVRVNMVSPDAVFGEGSRRSGLWEEVGPERMRARGLDEKGLEEYYSGRNLLKARITPRHVARAVLFFATRQAPVTGVTLPVDGGLPEATPR